MSNEVGVGGFYFPNVYTKNNEMVEDDLKRGNLDHAALTKWTFADEFLCFVLKTELLKFLDSTYPNPRQQNEVPIWFLVTCQFLLRIHQSGRYHHLKELLHSGSILTKVGFNVGSRTIGFNSKNKKSRKTAVDHDTVRKFFKDTDFRKIRLWHNQDLQSWFKAKKAFHRDGIFILDQTHIVVPKNKNYEDAIPMPVDEHGQFYNNLSQLTKEQRQALPYHPCYSLSSLLHTDRQRHTFHIAGYEFGPGSEDELIQAERFVPEFCKRNPGLMKLLIMDRGYISGPFIEKLKLDHDVDCLLPLKNNMDNYKDAIEIANRNDNWTLVEEKNDHDGKSLKRTLAAAVNDLNLWDSCSIPIHATVFKTTQWSDRKQAYKEYFWVLGSTRKHSHPNMVFQRYKIRTEIEERYKQFKLSWSIGKFPSPSKSLIESHLCFTLLTYSLLELYLRRHQFQNQVRQMIGSLRADESLGKHAVIVYSQGSFAALSLRRYTEIITELTKEPREKILQIMNKIEGDELT